jgi:hypothetical protein
MYFKRKKYGRERTKPRNAPKIHLPCTSNHCRGSSQQKKLQDDSVKEHKKYPHLSKGKPYRLVMVNADFGVDLLSDGHREEWKGKFQRRVHGKVQL